MFTRFRRLTRSPNTYLFLGSAVISYILFEVAYFLALAAGVPLENHPIRNLAAWSAPIARFDPNFGYRFNPKLTNDGLRVVKGDLQFYYKNIKFNSDGFRSNYEYHRKKDGKYRVVIYGDSFTAGLYQDRSWTESLNDDYRESGKNVEILNFSFDGGGVFNWHSHYFNVLKNEFEFDAVVFAICCNDLDRALAIYHADEQSGKILYRKFGASPRSTEEFLSKFRPYMYPIIDIVPSERLAEIVGYLSKQKPTIWESIKILPFDTYGADTIKSLVQRGWARIFSFIYDVGKPIKTALENFLRSGKGTAPQTGEVQQTGAIANRPPARANPLVVERTYEHLLIQMIDDLTEAGKPVTLITIPSDRAYIFRKKDDKNTSAVAMPKEVTRNAQIAEAHCLPHISGYAFFDQVERQTLNEFWPSYDGHWLTKGSDFFAHRVAEPLLASLRERSSRSCAAQSR